jgi:uncharacterized RDD family membrane protein YckC
MSVSADRVVIDAPDLWRPLEARAAALREENRRPLDTRRVGAYLLDGLILSPVTAAPQFFMGELGGALVAFAIFLSYVFVCEATCGQTIGKRILGLRVVRLDGGPLNIAACAARNVLLPIDWMFLLVALLLMVFGGRRQRIGDLVAGTVVTWAEDHPHTPARERFRTAVLVGYPLAWLTAALIAGTGLSHAEKHVGYLVQLQARCVAAQADLNGHSGVELVQQAAVSSQQVGESLSMIVPPASERAAHRRLVILQHRRAALLYRGASDVRLSRHPRRAALHLQRRLDRFERRAHRALRGHGYEACL